MDDDKMGKEENGSKRGLTEHQLRVQKKYGIVFEKRLRWAPAFLIMSMASTLAITLWSLFNEHFIVGVLLLVPLYLMIATNEIIAWYARHLDDEI